MKLSPKYALGAFSVIAITGIATAAMAVESAQTTAGVLKLNISANCEDGNVFFRVKNVGKDWPKTSTFAIYNMRKKSRKLISKRRMRLKDGQRASFKIKTAKPRHSYFVTGGLQKRSPMGGPLKGPER
ncbi:MAG: hypothetical protein IH994_12675 [Proteobacteria bacterium]|nr:hypothetical protein [Pseudomonadota bacterium]